MKIPTKLWALVGKDIHTLKDPKCHHSYLTQISKVGTSTFYSHNGQWALIKQIKDQHLMTSHMYF